MNVPFFLIFFNFFFCRLFYFSFGLRVQGAHRLVRPDECEVLAGGDDLLAEVLHLGEFFVAEFAEDEIDLLTFCVVVSDAHADSGVFLGADELVDVVETIVSAAASVLPHPECAERKVEVVADHDDALRSDIQRVHPIPYGLAAEVHVCRRFQEGELTSLDGDFSYAAVTVGLKTDIGCLSPSIQYHESHIVSGLLVLDSDISQSDYQVVHTRNNIQSTYSAEAAADARVALTAQMMVAFGETMLTFS